MMDQVHMQSYMLPINSRQQFTKVRVEKRYGYWHIHRITGHRVLDMVVPSLAFGCDYAYVGMTFTMQSELNSYYAQLRKSYRATQV